METHIGFAIPATTVKDDSEQGIAYPDKRSDANVVACGSAK